MEDELKRRLADEGIFGDRLEACKELREFVGVRMQN